MVKDERFRREKEYHRDKIKRKLRKEAGPEKPMADAASREGYRERIRTLHLNRYVQRGENRIARYENSALVLIHLDDTRKGPLSYIHQAGISIDEAHFEWETHPELQRAEELRRHIQKNPRLRTELGKTESAYTEIPITIILREETYEQLEAFYHPDNDVIEE